MGVKIEELGNRYGRLTVIKYEGICQSGHAMWKCLCDCGNEVVIRGDSLRRSTKSCGCDPKGGSRIDEIGNRYGYLSVIGYAGNDKKENATWMCICDCGNKTIVSGLRLRAGRVQSCGCKSKKTQRGGRKDEYGVAAKRVLISNYKYSAQRRDLAWELTDELFIKLTSMACHYCGIEPRQVAGNGCFGTYSYNGLDRVENAIGYTPSNVVPCCGNCNKAKRDTNIIEFRKWARQLSQHIENSQGAWETIQT